ncbi:MAG: Fic family protein [Nanoarchaeota archaeon]|nr:Fic family protein [Nanoarchaeota archaeon]
MYFKDKLVKGRRYRYAVKSARLPDGRVISLEKIYKKETKKELEGFFERRETEENFKYVLENFGEDSIFTEDALRKIEEMKLGYRKILRKLSRQSLRDLLDRFTVNFTYESNALEGNSLTLKDVAIVMFENASIKGKDLGEIYETTNSRVVVEMMFRNKFEISHDSIIKMHKLLVKDTGVVAGYKKLPNFILGRKINTTPPEKVYEEMSKLIEWYNQNREKTHPIKLAALFHGRFEQIHPFEDGNGRVGRLLVNVILLKSKYPPVIIRKSQRLSYLKTLQDFDKKYSKNLERFILEKFKETYRKFFEVYIKYL